MRITIDIPAEFEDHFAFDHFRDSLGRIAYDIRTYEGAPLSGKYEIETIEMLANALQRAEACQLPATEVAGLSMTDLRPMSAR